MGDVDPALLDHPLGGLMGFPFGLVLPVVALPFQLQAVRLCDVEHGIAADHRRARVFPLGLPLGGRAVGLVLRLLRLVVKLVKQHVGGLLALADLPAHVLDLLVGRPAVIAVATTAGASTWTSGHAGRAGSWPGRRSGRARRCATA